MARDIPMDKQLSKEDRAYLVARGAYGEAIIGRLDEQHGQDPASLPDPVPTQEVLTQNVANLQAENEALKAQLAALQGEDETPPYSEWLKADLQAEIDDRNADREDADKIKPASTTNADLAAALEADDAAAED